MANFCKYCGKALQDGEICSCPQAQAEAAQQYQGYQPQEAPQGYQPQEGPQGYQPQQPPQGPQGYQPQGPQGYQPQDPQGYPPQGYQQPPQGYQPQRPAGPSPVAAGLGRLLPFLKSYIKAPVSAVQALVNAKDMVVAGVLLCIQLIVSGLVLFSGLNSMVDSVSTFDASKLGTVVAAAVWQFGGGLKSDDPSFGMSFLMGILIALICVVVYVLIIFAVAKISGSQATFTDAFVAAGGHSPYVTVLTLLSFITFFMLFELGAILLVAAMLTWIVLTGPATQAIAHPNTTKEGTLWICTPLGVAIAVIFCGWIASMMIAVPFK